MTNNHQSAASHRRRVARASLGAMIALLGALSVASCTRDRKPAPESTPRQLEVMQCPAPAPADGVR